LSKKETHKQHNKTLFNFIFYKFINETLKKKKTTKNINFKLKNTKKKEISYYKNYYLLFKIKQKYEKRKKIVYTRKR